MEGACVRSCPSPSQQSSSVALLGESGAGQLAKMVNQIAIAGLVQAAGVWRGDGGQGLSALRHTSRARRG